MTTTIEEVEFLDRYQCFFVFEPGSIRISDNDILFIGDDIKTMYNDVLEKVSMNDDIKHKILLNKLQKIGNMIDLLASYDNVIITKFFDRIWRRYSYVSHLGESFLDLKTFLEFFPEYNTRNDILAQRVDIDSQSFEEEATDDDDDEDSNDDDSDNKENSSSNVEEEPTLSDLEDSETSLEASS